MEQPEIVEQNVSGITFNWFGREMLLTPVDGEAKWFRDELGYDWVKIRLVWDGNDPVNEIQTRVIRSDLVVDVRYVPRAPS